MTTSTLSASGGTATVIQVTIEILQGRNLASKDSNGLSDPFCKILVGDTVVKKTKVIPRSLNPSWEGEVVTLGRKKASSGPVMLEVWDHDKLSEPEFMGRAEIDVSPNGPHARFNSVWLPLQNRGIASERVSGDIQVTVRSSAVSVRWEGWLWLRK